MAISFKGFPPEGLTFLRRLKRNNNREWFQAHKDVYEEKLKAPMTELVLALGGAMQGFAPEMEAEPQKAIYRIYRDIRFSSDKTPYKTHIAAIFAPRGMSKNTSASLYFHVAPDEVVIAGGIYMPDAAALRALRRHIAAQWEELRDILEKRGFKRLFGGLEGERLSRVPAGFSADHPAADLLRYKQLYVYAGESAEFARTARLFPRLVKVFAAAMPLVRYLNRGLRQ